MAIPGTDLRSIPDFEAIAPIRDMASVEATGGKASDIQLEGVESMNEEMGPEIHAEIMGLVEQLGPQASLAALQGAVDAQSQGPAPGGMPGGSGGPGMMSPSGPQGILSNL